MSSWFTKMVGEPNPPRITNSSVLRRNIFRKPEMPDLSRGHQLFNSPGHIFHRHLRVHAVLVQNIHTVGAQPFECFISDEPDAFRAAVLAFCGVSSWKPNLVAITRWSRIGSNASPRSSSFVNGPYASAATGNLLMIGTLSDENRAQ